MSTEIEMHFDSGVLAIVPDLPDKPTACCTVFVFPLLHPSALPCLEGWPRLVLKYEFDKPVWATPGRYIARNMLLAFIEEAGNENGSLMIGASCRKGNRNTLVDVATAQIIPKATGHEDIGSQSQLKWQDI